MPSQGAMLLFLLIGLAVSALGSGLVWLINRGFEKLGFKDKEPKE